MKIEMKNNDLNIKRLESLRNRKQKKKVMHKTIKQTKKPSNTS